MQETQPAQAQSDDHSYLPPWMQPQASGASAAPPSLEAQYLNALDDPAAKQKAAGQRPQRHRSNTLFGLSLGFFGR